MDWIWTLFCQIYNLPVKAAQYFLNVLDFECICAKSATYLTSLPAKTVQYFSKWTGFGRCFAKSASKMFETGAGARQNNCNQRRYQGEAQAEFTFFITCKIPMEENRKFYAKCASRATESYTSLGKLHLVKKVRIRKHNLTFTSFHWI